MITLKEIRKVYYTSEDNVVALNKVSISFRDNEFVSIVGPSGCGKTTLLNVIGGLDHYTSGDLLINGKSTKSYRYEDWDSYRNSTIGFVFQNYNLIPHLSILENVAMALSLSGVSQKERTERAKKALERVGLEKQFKKRPNQLSGGQMQRVAIARALVNNPKILLADEPTGALDSKTSVQIMDLIKEIAKDRLVIMVSHNEQLAKEYSDRIVEMKDGEILEDSNPVKEGEIAVKQEESNLKNKKTRMSFLEALKSSFLNLLTKKGRTFATSIAGSIGIIGIGLVLSLSGGISSTITTMETETLSGFPISISDVIATEYYNPNTSGNGGNSSFPTDNIFYPYDSSGRTVTHVNKIDDELISYINAMDKNYYNSISLTRSVSINMIYEGEGGTFGKVASSSFLSELPDSKDFILSQYDVLAGSYPTSSKDLVLVVDEKNNISRSLLEGIGIASKDSYSVSDIIGKSFKVIGNDDFYLKKGSLFAENTDYQDMYSKTDENVFDVSITSILRVKKEAGSTFLHSGLSYSFLLTDQLISNATNSAVVIAQKASPDTNVISGMKFDSFTTYSSIMKRLGGDDTPTSINIYPKAFSAKDKIKNYIKAYNTGKSQADSIIYSDLAETITATLSTLVNTITIVLAAVAAISLVVSTIMISIIIYVSVIERTKEIGIMRSIGARRKDISRIFSAEAISIGLISGVLGIIVTYLLDIPLSLAMGAMMGSTFKAYLMPQYALILLAISVLLTFIAGLIPASKASKKDPVIALRTE